MYALSSEIGCTAINGAMAVDIPAGGQSVVLALDKKLIIAGDDNAKFVEVRWGTNAAIGSRPSPSWMGDILDGLVSIVGADKFDVNYIPAENKLYLQFSLDVTTEQIEEVKSLCARVLPSNVVTEMEWADGLPMTYTRLEYLECIGGQWIATGIVPKIGDEINGAFYRGKVTQANHTIFSAGTGDNQLVAVMVYLESASQGWSDSFYIRYFNAVATRAIVPIRAKIKFEANNEGQIFINGELKGVSTPIGEVNNTLKLLKRDDYTQFFVGRIYYFALSRNNRPQLDYIPTLDPTGKPCMFDLITREPFYNAATTGPDFIVGMTLEQVRDLRLPATGGQLTLSLPYEASIDGLAQAALEQARANGWVLTLQYDEAELPAGYTRLDYLESTGTQWMDTDITLEKFGKAVHDIQFTSPANKYMGFRAEDFSFATGLAFGVDPYGRLWYGGVGTFEQPGLLNRDLWTLSVNEGVAQLSIGDNFQKKKTLPSTNAVTIYSVFSGLNQVEGVMAKMYTVNIHDRSNQLQLAYIPCLDSEGVPCMYDLVTRQPFRNNGTGQFTVGMTLDQVRSLSLPAGGGQLTLALPYEASIDKLAQTALEQARENGWELTLQYAEYDVPAGYRKLDFLESTGTQWIDTGVKLSSESEVKCEWETTEDYSELDSTYTKVVYGVEESPTVRFTLYSIQAKRMRFDCPTIIWAEKPIKDARYKTEHSQTNGVYVNDDKIGNFQSEAFACTRNAQLFNRSGSYYFTGRIYSFTISSSGEMQLDYAPCITPEGKLGMYNKVDGSFQENKGSGSFIAGLATVDDVRNLWLPETNGELTISVPADTPDSAVDQLRTNNPTWQIAIQYRTDNEN